MNYTKTAVAQQQNIKIRDLLPEIGIDQMRIEIVQGLIAGNKRISSKYFYNKTGSGLFREITAQPEYYPTRTEIAILKEIAPKLMNGNAAVEIVELGSGDCSKISVLLDAVKAENHEQTCYIPVDVSKSAIEESAGELSEKFPQLEIEGYVADFMNQLDLIPHSDKKRLICFFGSTIGNFSLNESRKILQNLSEGLIEGDSLLVGFDLVKPEKILNAAYNDANGVTKKFNKNILNAVNSIIHSDFRDTDFDHFSAFNPEKSRVEMHLIANKNCIVSSPFLENPLHFAKGENIHTENSHKFSIPAIEELLEGTGLHIKNSYSDKNNWFALVQLGI